MLRFQVHHNGRPVSEMDLAGTYLVGSDGVPLRAELEFRDSQIICAKRADGPAGLAVLWPIPGCGAILSETGRLMDREQPYNLLLELVRGRLTRINQKREDWGLFDFEGIEQVGSQIDKARDLFIAALCADTPIDQSKAAEEALKVAFVAGEQLSQFHADLFLQRRKQQSPGFARRAFGCTIDLTNTTEEYRERFKEAFDFAYVPVPWMMIEPKQQTRDWQLIDSWVEWLTKSRMPIRMGPLVNLDASHIPDWLSQYEGDYESVRNAIVEHVRRIVERYGNYVFCWDVVSGIHAENAFNFTFEQIMDLTRVTVALVKQLASRGQVSIDLVAPWGEYYARNQRTIPPMFYADMVSQSGVGFDGIAAQFVFGAPADGMFVRDMFQISDKLDRLGNLGKPLHITAVQVPSKMIAEKGSLGGGCWLKPWDEMVQAKWVKGFYTVALSKPFVESITWRDLADRPSNKLIPYGGLLKEDLSLKAAYKVLKDLRTELAASQRRPPGRRSG